jgi:hypothetical protein
LKKKLLAIALVSSIISVIFVALVSFEPLKNKEVYTSDLFIGVTADGNVTTTKRLIDRVKGITNLLIINNPDVIRNKTSLNEVCHYAYDAGQSFFVFMAHPAYWQYNYDPFEWISESKEIYRDKFLGIHLYDEPGGNQLDLGNFRMFDLDTELPLDYREATYTYVYFLNIHIRDFIKTDKLVTSDYGLFWFDYEAGYDTIFCEFGSNRIKEINIPLCRGAAEMHNKTWGVMVAWKYDDSPYIESAAELFDDMVTAYQAGAKYIAVFNYPEIGQYGLLTEEHFAAIEQFRNYVFDNPQNKTSNVQRIAYVLPENYGWGFRNPNDKMWGVWEADENSQKIWDDINSFIEKYGYNFDILIDCYWTRFFAHQHYNTLYFWDGNTHTFG